MLTIVENCRVSPPPATVRERCLPLTFFDSIWLLFPPVHQLFFFDFPHSKPHFIDTIIPDLKHSLSITLQHFFPFAGNLIMFPNQNLEKKPEIRHVDGDYVAVTFAECTLDFNDLTGNHPRECAKFYPLVPVLTSPVKGSDFISIPLFSLQVTFFPNVGIAIGITNRHVLCDAVTKFDFLKAWTSIARNGTDDFFLADGGLPFYDRVIKYPNYLDKIYLNQPGVETLGLEYQPRHHLPINKVRATFVLTRTHINSLKKRVSAELPTLEYISSFSVVCAFLWSCISKSRVDVGEPKSEEDLELFVCAADCRVRWDPSIPPTYFGNCVGPCIATAKSSKVSTNEGFVIAAELLGQAISEMGTNSDELIKGAEKWIERSFTSMPTIGVAGTPKLKVYDLDFGWGKPKKYETVSMDYGDSISFNARKESTDDFEIGLSLPARQMDAFVSIFGDRLETLLHC